MIILHSITFIFSELIWISKIVFYNKRTCFDILINIGYIYSPCCLPSEDSTKPNVCLTVEIFITPNHMQSSKCKMLQYDIKPNRLNVF